MPTQNRRTSQLRDWRTMQWSETVWRVPSRVCLWYTCTLISNAMTYLHYRRDTVSFKSSCGYFLQTLPRHGSDEVKIVRCIHVVAYVLHRQQEGWEDELSQRSDRNIGQCNTASKIQHKTNTKHCRSRELNPQLQALTWQMRAIFSAVGMTKYTAGTSATASRWLWSCLQPSTTKQERVEKELSKHWQAMTWAESS